MLKSGRTPLVRARMLEKKLNIKEIYLKLEGQNPTGHKHDRIAEVLVRNAIAHKNEKIIAYGSLSFITSIIYFADFYNIKTIVPLFKNERWKKLKFKDEYLMDFRDLKNPNLRDIFQGLSNDMNAFIAAEGYTNTHISQMVLENLICETLTKVKFELDTVTIQLGYGHTMTSLYNTFLKNWMNGNMKDFPIVYCGTWKENNEIYKRYLEKNTKKYLPENLDSINTEHIPKESFQMDKNLIKETLQAVAETDGILTPINEKELKKASKLLNKAETINIDYKEAYPLAAFIKNVEAGKINNGKHIIILNDAKTIANIQKYDDSIELSIDELVNMTKNWLAEYCDSTIETKEAVENAIEKGYLLLASRNGVYEGICVIVDMSFDIFIPKYHLAYIGTSDKFKGRGIGSELLQRAIDLTKGNISLHVDLDNKGAKKVYEKYGFKHMYNRMIYKESE
ncbi:pyridoxal-phosphate dependent enzyme [Peptostreptococcaceae bacterium AGR-M142]